MLTRIELVAIANPVQSALRYVVEGHQVVVSG
jgi:hypothetical protein